MVLKHRDKELLRFEWIEPQGVRVVSVNDAERKFLPLEMKGVASDVTLWTWLTRRVVPKHRHYIQMMLGNLGIIHKDTKAIIEICKGLSLNDVYFKRHKYYNLPVDRLRKIEDFLQKRVREIIEFGEEADGLLAISPNECTVNRADDASECTQNSDSLSLQIKQNMKADPFITKKELAELLQVSPRWIARKMKDLQAAGEIRRVGADKNGWWDVLK